MVVDDENDNVDEYDDNDGDFIDEQHRDKKPKIESHTDSSEHHSHSADRKPSTPTPSLQPPLSTI
jgi:hypothetical protein